MLPVPDYNKLSPAEAIALQQQLHEKINLSQLDINVSAVAGADISFNKFEETVYAGIVVFSYPDMKIVERTTVMYNSTFPYIPGLLAFRELPALITAWNQLQKKPDILILDGQGIAHPRRMGIATHFGIISGVPAIGCAKTKLAGDYDMPANSRFACSPMMYKKEQVGIALRTKINCKPVLVSPGNLINTEQSVEIITNCVRHYRIPEPTRMAHNLVNEVRLATGKNLLF